MGLEGEAFDLFRDYSLVPEAIWSCLVADNLGRLLRDVPREQVLVLQYEALKDDPLPHFRRTCAFLDIDPDFTPSDVRRPVNRRAYVVDKPDPGTRERLRDYFAAEVERLAALLPELDLGLWPDFAASRISTSSDPLSGSVDRSAEIPTADTDSNTHSASGATDASGSDSGSTPDDVASVLRRRKTRRLLLGCGQRPDPDCINVDLDPDAKADLYLDASDLGAIPDGSLDEIRSYHLFEHFTRAEARRALREWFRVLRPGGVVILELPNLEACARELGRHFDPQGEDLALTGIFGPPERADSPPQRHNWGWTPQSLAAELVEAGFQAPELHPIDQTWRLGTPFGRDMQVRARR